MGHGCNFGAKFPYPATINQFLTPQIFNSLCRLGNLISADAIAAASRLEDHAQAAQTNVNTDSRGRTDRIVTLPAGAINSRSRFVSDPHPVRQANTTDV